MKIRSEVDHAKLAAYVEHMKGVYQRTLDKRALAGGLGRDLHKIKNHLQCLSMIQKLLSEHHEMAQGRAYDAGSVGFDLCTLASLIKPNGEVILIPRRVP
jgi:hypothetical protein